MRSGEKQRKKYRKERCGRKSCGAKTCGTKICGTKICGTKTCGRRGKQRRSKGARLVQMNFRVQRGSPSEAMSHMGFALRCQLYRTSDCNPPLEHPPTSSEKVTGGLLRAPSPGRNQLSERRSTPRPNA